jgi:hypothetical protein
MIYLANFQFFMSFSGRKSGDFAALHIRVPTDVSAHFRPKFLSMIARNKTGTSQCGMLYVDNPEFAGDHRACRIGERIGSVLTAVPWL